MKKASFSIESAEGWIVRVPMKEDLVSSEEFGDQVGSLPRLMLRLVDGDGIEGWGERLVPGGMDFEEVLRDLLKMPNHGLPFMRLAFNAENNPWLKPKLPSPYEARLADLTHRLRHPLHVVYDSAVHDLLARRAGVPLCFLLGGPWRDKIPVSFWAGRVTPEKAAEVARYGRDLGFKGIKLKSTLQDPNVERLEAIKDAVGVDWPVTVDPNGRFYRFNDALKTILDMDAVGNLDILEDPFPRFHLQEFAMLRPRVRARVVVHIDPPETIGAVIASGAAGGLNIDGLEGVHAWLEQAAVAHSANLPVWHGSGLDFGIATAHQLHLMASARNAQLPGDQVGPWLRETSFLKAPFTVKDGLIDLPKGAGIGVEVDVDELERRAEKHFVVRRK